MHLAAIGRITVSVLVFVAVLWFVDVHRLSALLFSASTAWLSMALLANVLGMYVAAHVLSTLCAGTISPSAVFRVNLISIYFGIFLPGDVAAGLVSRIRYLNMSSWQQVLHGTVVERLVGLVSFSAIAGAALPWSLFWRPVGWAALALPTMVLILAIGALLILSRPQLAVPWLRRFGPLRDKLTPKVPLTAMNISPRAFAWSLAAFLCASLVPYAIMRSLGVEVRYVDAVVIGYMLTLAQLVPFFFAGIGIRDVSAVALLAIVHIDQQIAVAFSTLVLGVILLLALAGGLLQMVAERSQGNDPAGP